MDYIHTTRIDGCFSWCW